MEFYKLEATGNDFILVVDDTIENIDVKKLCDRHNGIGADGIITIDKALNIKIFNSDGSQAKMCGNGLRCVCKLLNHLTNEKEFHVLIDNSRIYIKQIDEGNAMVEMPLPIMISYENGYFVSLLNNHYVIVTSDISSFKFDENLKKISSDKQCNIHAIEILNRKQIKMKSYEYGVGETKSCGSGSLACFFAMYMLGKVEKNVSMIQAGGTVNCLCKNNKYYILGPVNLICKGEVINGF